MAAALGQTIGKAVKVTEGNVGGQDYANSMVANSRARTGSFTESLATFAPGAIKVEAHVTVSFQLN